jgi:hypothetical protein
MIIHSSTVELDVASGSRAQEPGVREVYAHQIAQFRALTLTPAELVKAPLAPHQVSNMPTASHTVEVVDPTTE